MTWQLWLPYDHGMKGAITSLTRRNFHVPLPEALYRMLHDEATSLKQPATALAREAIESWLRERKRTVVREAIAKYAAEQAGKADLDHELESATLELLVPPRRRKR